MITPWHTVKGIKYQEDKNSKEICGECWFFKGARVGSCMEHGITVHSDYYCGCFKKSTKTDLGYNTITVRF